MFAVCVLAACTPVDRDDVPDRRPPDRDRTRRDPVPLPGPEPAPDPGSEPAPQPEPEAAPEGCFSSPVTTALDFSPNGSTTADVNADAVLDYVTFRDELVDGQFVVHIDTYLGDRDGRFRRVSSAPYAKGGLGVAFGYLDADPHLDMITGDHRAASFTEWRGDGEGGFRPTYTRKTGSSPHTPLLADLDGDGREDLLLPRYRMIEVYRSKSPGKYEPRPWINVAKSKRIATPEGMDAVDLDADGILDLVVPLSDDNALAVYMGRGNGRFRAHSRFESPCSSPQDSAIADFDQDGHPDVAIGCGGLEIVVYSGDGTGDLKVAQRIQPPGYLVDLIAADATGDGRPDLVASGYASDPSDPSRFSGDLRGYVAVLARDESGEFREWARTLVGMHYTHGLRVDDVNEDGMPDVLFAGGGGMPGSHLGVSFGRPCPYR